eukprot:2884082-Rhodomonas_salina.4
MSLRADLSSNPRLIILSISSGSANARDQYHSSGSVYTRYQYHSSESTSTICQYWTSHTTALVVPTRSRSVLDIA